MLGAPPGPGNTMERPYIHELRIENYGCIRDATFRFTPLHALIGPNDSGKSTVLRALRTVAFTLDVAVDAPASSGSPTRTVRTKARSSTVVRVRERGAEPRDMA